MRADNVEHKHLISTDPPPPAPASTEALSEDVTWFEDAYGTLSFEDRACLDKNLNSLANISESELTQRVRIKDEYNNNNPDQGESLMAEMMELDNIPLMAGFEEMNAIAEVQSAVMCHDVPSPSLDIDAEMSDMGHCEISYTPTKNCKRSESNEYFHVARDQGILKLGLKFTDINLTDGVYIIRAVLVRKNEEFKHFPVNTICRQHAANCDDPAAVDNVLQPPTGFDLNTVSYSTPEQGARRSLEFQLRPEDLDKDNNTMTRNIALRFRCNASCVTTKGSEIKTSEAKKGEKEKKETAKEAAQDLQLILSLEVLEVINNKAQMRILARRSLDVWPKEAINPRDLNKPKRMKDKGGKATQKKRERDQGGEEFARRVVSEAKRMKLTKCDFLTAINREWGNQ